MSHGRKFTLLVACIFCCIPSAIRADSPVTEEEIKVLMEQGAEAGVFEEHEQELVAAPAGHVIATAHQPERAAVRALIDAAFLYKSAGKRSMTPRR